MSWLWAEASAQHPGVDGLEVRRRRRAGGAAVHVDPHAPGDLEPGHEVRRGDEGLAGHAVGEDGRAADTVALHHGDRGSELGGNQRCLVATGATTEDDDGRMAFAHVRYPTTRAPADLSVAGRPPPGCPPFVRNRDAHPLPTRWPQGIPCGQRPPGIDMTTGGLRERTISSTDRCRGTGHGHPHRHRRLLATGQDLRRLRRVRQHCRQGGHGDVRHRGLGGMDALVAAAKKEGTLNVIALPPDWANYGEVIKAFEAKYGIKVDQRPARRQQRRRDLRGQAASRASPRRPTSSTSAPRSPPPTRPCSRRTRSRRSADVAGRPQGRRPAPGSTTTAAT